MDPLKKELAQAIAEYRAVWKAAEDEKRELTGEEKERSEKAYAVAEKAREKLLERDKDEKQKRDIERWGENGIKDAGADLDVAAAGTLGEKFVAAEGYKAMQGRFKNEGGAWSTGEIPVLDDTFKTGMAGGDFIGGQKTVLTEGAGSGANLLQPDVQPGILPLLFRRLTVAALIPQGQTGGITVRYLQETTFTNAAAPTAEGALKPESTLVFAQVDEPVRKIAHFLPVTEEMLEDVPGIRSYIDGRLTLGVQLTEEDQLLNGNGTPPNLQGILQRSGLQAAQARGADNNPDAILKQANNIRINAFAEPDAVIIHPSNWQAVQLGKDAQGQYYGGGPFAGQLANQLWGLRVVVTPAIAAGTALVGSFGAWSQIFRRGGLRVEASNSHSDFFQRNQVAIRAEERLALAVYRPAAFGTVTGLA